MPRLERLRRELEKEIASAGGLVIASEAPRIATIGAYAMPGASSANQLVQLDLAGISVSAGSACSSGSMKPSRVVSGMGVPERGRLDRDPGELWPLDREADIDRFLTEWRKIGNHAKAQAA